MDLDIGIGLPAADNTYEVARAHAPPLDFAPPATQAAFWPLYEAGVRPRPKEFDGLEPVQPGIVPVHEWRAPAGATPRTSQEVAIWGAVARKP